MFLPPGSFPFLARRVKTVEASRVVIGCVTSGTRGNKRLAQASLRTDRKKKRNLLPLGVIHHRAAGAVTRAHNIVTT